MKFFLSGFLFFWTACSPVLPIHDPFLTDSPDSGKKTSEPSPLRILAMDVGQGDATLVMGPTGKTLLIDAGPAGAGLAKVLPTVRGQGLESLDWIVATHYDADHVGGIPEVLKGEDQAGGTKDDVLPTSALIDRGGFTDKATPSYEKYLETAPSNRQEARPGLVLDLGDGAEARVIVADGRYADGRSVHLNPDEENEASIGLLIRYGNFSYFTAGDLPGGGSPGGYETKDLETTAGEIVGDLDVLHAGHHGSASSSNEGFLDETAPENVLISVGRDNDYGHPARSVLERLESRGINVHRTDRLGDIVIETNGEDYWIMAR